MVQQKRNKCETVEHIHVKYHQEIWSCSALLLLWPDAFFHPIWTDTACLKDTDRITCLHPAEADDLKL